MRGGIGEMITTGKPHKRRNKKNKKLVFSKKLNVTLS